MRFSLSLLLLFQFFVVPVHSAPVNLDASSAAIGTASKGLSLGVSRKVSGNSMTEIPAISPVVSKTDDSCCLKGTITWKTNAYKTENKVSFPLINAKVSLYKNNEEVLEDYTDFKGNYCLSLKDRPDVWSNLSQCELRIILKSSECVLYTRRIDNLIDSNDCFSSLDKFKLSDSKTTYCLAGKNNIEVAEKNPDSNVSVIKDLDYSCSTYTGQFFQLYTMMQLYSWHARKLNSGMQNGTIPPCNIVYPCEVDKDHEKKENEYDYVANYVYDDQVIQVPQARINPDNEKMYSFSSWDLIGHEYGHHLEQFLGFKIATGEHKSSQNDCDKVVKNNEDKTRDDDPATYGRILAWDESWPTFFSIAAQKSFPTTFTDNIYALGDDKYDAYNYDCSGGDMPLTSIDGYGNVLAGGDACEESIMRFLYQLWDGRVGTVNDECSEKKLWSDVCYAARNGAENFSQFYDDLFLFHDGDRLRELASIHGMSVSGITPSLSDTPVLSWDGETKHELDDRNTEKYRYLIHVYDSDRDEILTLNNNSFIDDTSYQLTEDEFELVSGETLLLTIEKMAYNVDEDQKETFLSDFVSEDFSVRFPKYERK